MTIKMAMDFAFIKKNIFKNVRLNWIVFVLNYKLQNVFSHCKPKSNIDLSKVKCVWKLHDQIVNRIVIWELNINWIVGEKNFHIFTHKQLISNLKGPFLIWQNKCCSYWKVSFSKVKVVT